MGKAPNDGVRVIAENRKARHEYDILERLEVGLVLVGSEVKSLRSGRGNIAEAFVKFIGGEAFLVDCHVPHYAQAGQFNHEPRRQRKLLAKRSELDKLYDKVQTKGLTLVPLKLFFKGAWVKVELGLARGRKMHDKRHALKAKQDKRDMARALRER
jgi:SsrA-binding protein